MNPAAAADPRRDRLTRWLQEDLGIAATRIEPAGGRIHRPKMAIGEYGFIVLAFDTEGNMIGLHSMT